MSTSSDPHHASSPPIPHVSILASAGSGKTFQLTNRYLRLVAAGAPIGGLLASTFTRKAAGEIRDRILMRLAEAADDEEKRAELAEWIAPDTENRRFDRGAVLELLRGLTGNLHLIQIRTLDSFFASVVQAYAIELGIAPASEPVDDAVEEKLRHEAIRRMLATRDSASFVMLLRRLTQGGSDRSVMHAIDSAVVGLYELYRESDAAAWRRFVPRRELDAAELAVAIGAIDGLMPSQAGLVKTMRADLDRAQQENWMPFLGTGLAKKIAKGESTYRSKALPPEVIDAYAPLVEHAKAVLWNRIIYQTTATREMLELFDAQFRIVKHKHRALTFADLTAAMSDAQRSLRFDEICFRLDGTVEHLMLDEFQDTSVQQWRALEPIVTEILDDDSRGRTFFCVGDVKQSIYGWRGACPEILQSLPELRTTAAGDPAITQERLSVSYRSSPVIIDVVNRVFGSLRHNPVLASDADAAARFAADFEDHATTKTGLPGYAEFRTVRCAPPDGDQKQTRLRDAAELVSKLHRKSPRKNIAVLTRTNASVARLLYEFSASRLDVPASGHGGGPLTDTPAVNAVLDLLTLADHPDDTIAAFNVARGPLGAVVGLTDEHDASRRRQGAADVRRRLIDRGYAETIGGWTAHLAPSCDERGFLRLLQLVEQADAYDARATLRSVDFVRSVEKLSVAASSPAPVQVMTVHQSKGLEFDIVVLPELEFPMAETRARPVVYERAGGTGPVTGVCRWVNKDVLAAFPEIQPLFQLHRERAVRETLCLLYVALTRAKQGLYMLIDPAKLKKDGTETIKSTAAGVLRCALTDESPPGPEEVLFTGGDPMWIVAEERADPSPPAAPILEIALQSPAARFRGGAARSASEAARAQTIGAALALRDDEPRERGSAIHKLFEQIEWIETFEPDRATLLHHVRVMAPRRDGAWREDVVDAFLTALEHPEVRSALSRGAAPPERIRVQNERPFVRLVDGRLQQGSIDRLVLHLDDAGGPIRATVIDFKTDMVTPAEATEQAERYRGQVEDYRAITAHIFGVDRAAVEMLLLFVRPGVGVTLAEGVGV